MSIKVPVCNPFYLHTRKPEINKIKVQESIHNHWDIPSRVDFPQEILNNSMKLKSQSNFSSRKGELFSLSQNHSYEDFHAKLIRYGPKLIKKKSTSEINVIPDEFSCLKSTHPLVETKQKSRHFSVTRRRNDNVNFNVKDIQTLFPKKSSVCLKSPPQALPDFENSLISKPEKCKTRRKLSKENLSINDTIISLAKTFSTELNQTASDVPNNFSLKCNNSVKINESSKIDSLKVSNILNFSLDFHLKTDCDENRSKCMSTENKACFTIFNGNLKFFNSNEDCMSNEIGRGSNWIQSLQWTANEAVHEKTKLSNILPGGFADQLLKLQRREKSEIALQDHQVNAKKKDNGNDSVSVIVLSLLHVDDIAVTLCCSSNNISAGWNKSGTYFNEEAKTYTLKAFEMKEEKCFDKFNYFLVLFQKSLLNKLHLKIGSCYLLLQPWHYIELNLLQYPVILCKYFKNITTHTNSSIIDEFKYKNFTNLELNWKQNTANLILKDINARSRTEPIDLLYFKWGKSINLAARIQRIWNQSSRVLFLLQTKDGAFHVLTISVLNTHQNWQICIEKGEGKCYIFENLRVAQRFDAKKYSHLFKFLTDVLKKNANTSMNQEFIYQMVINDISAIPCEIKDTSFPVFIPINFQQLAFIQKKSCQIVRLSCVASILLQFKNTLYITDQSIFNSSSDCYIKVLLQKVKTFSKGSTIEIKDALLKEDTLLLDQYSQLSLLHQQEPEVYSLLDLKIPLKYDLKISDLAIIGGQVIAIDESEACTWLQCNFCLQENLTQDGNQVIFCEDCSSVLTKPLLNVKMSVTIFTSEIPDVLSHVQLLSETAKRILQLEEDIIQPQCSVKDVLGCQVNSLFCYIQGYEVKGKNKVFYLSEIDPT